ARRGHGLGRALMEAALGEARARGADTMDIGVDEPDLAARSVYESLGFTNRIGGPDGPLMYVYQRDLGQGGSGAAGDGLAPPRQHPARAREVARVPVRIPLEVVLMLGLGLPERPRGRHLGDDLARPQPGRLDVGDRVLGDPALLVVEVEDRRA